MTRRAPEGVDTSTPVLVVKMVRDHYAHGRLGVVRSLGRMGVPVHCLHESRHSPAARSRYGTHLAWPITVPPPSGALDELCRLGDRLGGWPVLVPSDDVSALFVDAYAEALRKVFRFPEQPPGLAERLADKAELYGLCREFDIPTPEIACPSSRREVEEFIERGAVFPVVVKSIDPRVLRERPGAQSVVIARTSSALLEEYERMEVPGKPNLLFQEYIPGGAESVWVFNGYFDADSECLAGFTGRKLRQHPPRTGAATLGVCESNEAVAALTRRFMKAIGYQGIVDMGYRFDARDGQYKLLDVNPRMGASFRLFVGSDGMDVVRAMYLDLTGQRVPPTSIVEGRRWWVEPNDLWTRRQLAREGEITWRGWWRSLRGVQEAAWFARDDPLPFAAVAALFVAHPLYRALARTRWAVPKARRLIRRLEGID